MNGHARDQIDTDLASGRPTISPSVDPLVLSVVALLGMAEGEALFEELEHEVGQSPAFQDWTRDASRYLSEFDAGTAALIEHRLTAMRQAMRDRARERGWEVEPDEPVA